MSRFLPLIALAGAAAFFATSSEARDCASDARSAMLDVRHPVPMLQHVETTMGEITMRSQTLSTPDNRGLVMDEAGTPMSLWIDGKFYTTADKGETWKLLSETSKEDQDKAMETLRLQAEAATNITCDYEAELDGKPVHRFSLDYVLEMSGTPLHVEYWIDAETGFPWRIRTVSPQNTIVQDIEPAPVGMSIPDPEG